LPFLFGNIFYSKGSLVFDTKVAIPKFKDEDAMDAMLYVTDFSKMEVAIKKHFCYTKPLIHFAFYL
jgi:hypothetical protein